ncbi:MAG: pspA [Parcubacteria group bacterium]|nr:pspA [Parcubacteria group bacterium]
MHKQLYFVRHGETDSNADGVFRRGNEATLSAKGREEAMLVAERLKRIGIDTLVVSSYKRALETASLVETKLGIQSIESGFFDEARRPSIQIGNSIHDPEMKAINRALYENYPTPGWRHSDEENFDDLKERAIQGLMYLQNLPGERICIITHGIFLRFLLCALVGRDFNGRDVQRALRMHIGNTGITYARDTELGWEIMSWNDVAHLG